MPICPALIFGLLLLSIPVAANTPPLKIPKNIYVYDVRHDYYKKLLEKALIRGANGREIPQLQETSLMDQARVIQELNRGNLVDVFWMGTSILREQKLRAIKVPLERGLIGYRRFIIRADQKSQFDAISSIEDLKGKVACQGHDWPDTDILRAAGIKVNSSSGFEVLFKMLAAKRCDFFPRGYFEADGELNERLPLYPQLQVYDSLILHYPLPIYFFVKKDNEMLAQWIEQGLEKMIDTGELLTYMKSHPLTNHVFPLNRNLSLRHIIEIPNPFLPGGTNYLNTHYWFLPTDFQTSVKLPAPN